MAPRKKAAAPKKKATRVDIATPGYMVPVSSKPGYYGMTGYHSARMMRDVDGTTPTNAAGSRHEMVSRLRLVTESRAFVRDNLLYKGILERCIDFSIGAGFELMADDPVVDALWSEWIASAEISGRYEGAKLARAVAREYLTTGEGIVLKINGGGIQLIESEQIVQYGANANSGVETDKYGRPTGYWIAPYINGNLSTPKRINAKDVIFVCERERPSSVRGVPPLQTAFPMLHRINDTLDAEALAMQLLSRIVMKHMSDSGQSSNTAGLSVRELPFGLIFEGDISDDLVPMDRNIPGKDFPQSIEVFCRMMGLPLGMPLELVMLDWTKSNFSQMRGALVLADKRFKEIRDLFISDFYEPLFRWKYNQWAAEGLIDATPQTLAHEWIAPQFPWVNPLEEATAQEKMIELGLTTHEEAVKQNAKERPKVIAQLKRETVEAIEAAREIEAQTGILPPWQPFAGRVVGKTESANLVNKEKDSENADE